MDTIENESVFVDLPSTTDGGPTRNGAVGLVTLATDHLIELDLRRLLPQDRLPLFVSRVAMAQTLSVETLGAMRDDISRAASLILPGTELSVVAYGCTSGTIVIGEDEVFAEIRKTRPGVACTTPPTAALAAFKALGMKRIAVLTPYPRDVNRRVRAFLEKRGLEVVVFGSFGKGGDFEISTVTEESVAAGARALDRAGIDGIFLSCTALRAIDVVEQLEAALGKPVVSSNQALAWHAMRLAGVNDKVPGFGRLFRI